MLDLQPAEARRLLLRTSVPGRVNGELADLLTGGSGRVRGRVDLEEANTFVVPLDAARSWFRYLGDELRALALVSLGIPEFWAARFEEAERHLDEGVTLARRIGRPFLEFRGLVYQAGIELFRSFTRAAGLAGDGGTGSSPRLAEPLSHSELRVLRYLPTHLSAPEIAGELGA